MEKDAQPADSQQQTKVSQKTRKPWSMWWVALFILSYMAVYTYLRFK